MTMTTMMMMMMMMMMIVISITNVTWLELQGWGTYCIE